MATTQLDVKEAIKRLQFNGTDLSAVIIHA